MYRLAILLLFIFPAKSSPGKGIIDSMVVSLDFPSTNKENKFYQRLSYEISADTVVDLRIKSFYLLSPTDSLLLYDQRFEKIRFKAGARFTDLAFSKAAEQVKADPAFFDVVQKFRMVPAGSYRTYVELAAVESKAFILGRTIHQFADSNLTYSSGLRDKMNAAVNLPGASIKKGQQKLARTDKTEEIQLQSSEKKMKRGLRSVKGLEIHPLKIGTKTYSQAYYKGFFMGRYEMASVKDLNARAENESKRLTANSGSLIANELEGFTGIGSQLKDLNTKNEKNKEAKLNGTLDVSSYRATAQDPQSAIEQNYTEILLSTDVELMGMPFMLEGFYTTQDQNRKAKASYIRFHYDIESAKSKLASTIQTYKSKLGETGSKGQGLENIYGNYAKSLEAQKGALLKGLAKEYEIDPQSIMDNKGNADKIASTIADITGNADTAKLKEYGTQSKGKALASAGEKREKLKKNSKEISERYQKIIALQEKAAQYYALLENYRTKTHLDSAINYKKMAGLENKDASYKEMSKAAEGILPEGKAKSFVTGLTNFDAGIINKNESGYTMAGQNLKGFSLGYDLGIFKAGITAGSTEYVSRDGNVDNYSTLLLRADNTGSQNHKVGVIYSLTTPSNAMGIDENFIGKQSIRYPGFKNPTHIVSLVYDGKITKRLSIQSEWASSFKKDQLTSLDMAHAAMTNTIDYSIPKTTMNISGTWEHLGRSFENNTLPYIRSGTERYTLSTSVDLFKSFLSLKVDYNYLEQENFASRSYNRKWGFDVRTHSKRYPSVSLSYKPFSTFRSLSDTLQIAQRPIQGEVWTARSSYQIKRNKKVHRFTLMYNKNTSNADTVAYSSSITQMSYTYSNKDLSLNVSLSRMEIPVDFADGSGMVSSYMTTIAFTKSIGKYVTVMLSPDIAFCGWGLQRKSAAGALTFKIPNKPLTLRTMLRYSDYRLTETSTHQELFAGQFGLNWMFKTAQKKKVQ